MGAIFVPTGRKNAQQLVQLAMDLVHHFDNTVFRTGFSTDTDTTGTAILDFLNMAQEDLLPTGYCKCYYALNLVAGQAEYGLSPDMGEIIHARLVDQAAPLLPVTVLGEDVRNPGWQNVLPEAHGISWGTPTAYYSTGDVVGFVPTPDDVYTCNFWADSVPPSLQLIADVPARLPSRYHSTLAIKAAIYMCNADAENPAAKERLPLLTAEFNIKYQELEALVRSRIEAVSDHMEVEDYRGRYTTSR